MSHRRSVPAALSATACAALAGLLLAGAAQAQVYRVVGADGMVSFSDKPPAQGGREPAAGAATDSGGNTGALPYQLAQTAQRYPVTLYTGKDCAPCNSGRNLLVNRGVPFSEKTVDTNDDLAALQRLSGSTELPVLTIGGQRLKGYADGDWSQYLDAAGYPKTSQLPASYRRPAARPLTTPRAAAPAAAASNSDAAAPTTPGTAAQPSVAPPSGIRF